MRLIERLGLAWKLIKADSGVTSQVPWDDFWYASNHGFQTATGLRVSPESALRVAAVFACVRVVSETVASCPAIVYRRLPNGGKERALDHPLYNVLHYKPNQWQTAFEWAEMMQAHLELRGNAFSVINPGPKGAIDSLVPVHPDRVNVYRLPNGRLKYEVRSQFSAQPDIYLQEEMFHIRGMSADGLVGMSTVAVGAETIACGLATQEHAGRFFQNGSTPSGVFTAPKALNDEQYERYKRSIREATSGGNAHKAMVLEEGMTWMSIGVNNKDSQFLEAREFSRSDIASMWRVPPHKIGDLSRATFCLPAGTDVLTDGGPKPVEAIAAGDIVWSRSDAGEWIKSKVLRSDCSGVDPILKIRTTNRTLRANAKHRILARKKYPYPQSGQGGYQSVRWADEYVAVGDLRVGDTIIAMDGGFASERRVSPTGAVTPGFMAFCGLLLGDGNINANHGVTIARAQNAPYMDYYREVMRASFVRYEKYSHGNTVVAMAPITLCESERQTRFASVLAARELTDLGFAGTAHTKHVPKWVFGMAEDLRLAFLRGFADADGHVDKKGRMSMSSCNRDLLTGMRHLCMMSGIPVTNLRCQKGNTKLPNGKRIDFEQWAFTCSDPGANRRIGSANRFDVLRMDNGKPFLRKARNYPRFGAIGAPLHGASMSRIVAITAEPEEPVYDIEVGGTHNFVADGVIVHNSNIEQQNIEFATDCIRPRLVRFERRIHNDLIDPLDLGDGNDYFCQFDMDAQLRGDMKSRYESYAVGRQWGWLSANDICSMENRNPLPTGGDEYLRPLNMVDVGTANPDAADQGIEQGDSTATGSAALPGRRQKQLTDGKLAAARLKEFAQNAAERVVRREVNALKKILEKSDGNGAGLAAIDEFYRTHEEFVAEAMCIDHVTAAVYVKRNRSLFFTTDSCVAIAEIESYAAGILASLALDEKEHQPSERPIHITMPAQTINLNPTLQVQPMEMKVSVEQPNPGKRSVVLTRDKDGRVEKAEIENDRKVVTVTRDKTGRAEKLEVQ